MDRDLIIIGGGPAGLTAAIYAGRAKLKTLLLDKQLPGGQLNETTEVENFPGFEEAIQGPELMRRMRAQAERFGVEILMEEATDVAWGASGEQHTVITDQAKHQAPVVIVATGAAPKELPATGAKQFKGRGLSYCATCDGFFYQGKTIVEVGAGDAGFTETLFLTRFAKEIRMVVRHPKDDPRALRAKDRILVDKVLEHAKVKFIWNGVVHELKGDGLLKSVVLKDLKTGELSEQTDVSGVFVNIGHAPAIDFLHEKLDRDARGYLVTDPHMRTKVPGVFAIGDVRALSGQYAQAVIAAGDGCVAALGAEHYLEDHKWPYEEP
jgi:thioredoxin reductase (NADPH)